MPKVYTAGDVVYALWPGSMLYYKATVQSYDPVEREYVVKFESTEDVMNVSKRSVVSVEYIEGQGRGRSSSPARRRKSPSRSRSSSRSRRRGRSTSPARSKKMQQAKKLVTQEKESTEIVEIIEQKTEISFQSESNKEEHMITTKAEKSENSYKRKLRSSNKDEGNESKVKEATAEEEEKNAVVESKPQEDKPIGWPRWLLKQFGLLLLMILVTGISPTLYLLCPSKGHCSILKFPVVPKWTSFFKIKSFCFVAGWVLVLIFLFLLPVGKVCQRSGYSGKPVNHRGNGLHALVVCIALVAGFSYAPVGRDLLTYVIREYLSVTVAGTVIIALVSFTFMLLTRNSPESKSEKGASLSSFLLGRQYDPSPPWFDLKVFLYSRAVFLSSNTFLLCYVADTYLRTRTVNPAVGMVTVASLLVCIYHFATEEMLIHSKNHEHLTTGYLPLLVFLLGLPFCSIYRMRCLLYLQKANTPQELACLAVVLVLGTYMFISSNYQKLSFRFNPSAEYFKEAQIVVTPDGRNLLCHGWWGRIRHPNYVADILLSIGWALPCGFTHFLPWCFPVCIAVVLLYLAFAEEQKCQRKHGNGWSEYKARVPYSMIPLIY